MASSGGVAKASTQDAKTADASHIAEQHAFASVAREDQETSTDPLKKPPRPKRQPPQNIRERDENSAQAPPENRRKSARPMLVQPRDIVADVDEQTAPLAGAVPGSRKQPARSAQHRPAAPVRIEPKTQEQKKGCCGLLQTSWALSSSDEQDRDLIFQLADTSGPDIFFPHLTILPDGGLYSKDSLEEKLFTTPKILEVVAGSFFVCFNVYLVLANAFRQINEEVHKQGWHFPVLMDYNSEYCMDYFWMLRATVATIESVSMLLVVLYCLEVAVHYVFFSTYAESKHYRIWHQMYTVCCVLFKSLQVFSAMSPLDAVHPQKAGQAILLEKAKLEKEGARGFEIALSFIVWRVCYGGFGFMAFCVKFAEVVLVIGPYVALHTEPFGLKVFVIQVATIFGFLNQVLGISRIQEIETQRLFLVIFGGQDCLMQAGELDRQEVYLASVMRIICTELFEGEEKTLFDWKKRCKRFVALFAFSHKDIQSMVIHEDESKELDARHINDGEFSLQAAFTKAAVIHTNSMNKAQSEIELQDRTSTS